MSTHAGRVPTKQRWLPCYNAYAGTIPAFALVKNSGPDSDVVLAVTLQAEADSTAVYATGHGALLEQSGSAKNYGECTNDWPAFAAFNSSDGTPAVGEEWGLDGSGFVLRKDRRGFLIEGGIADAATFPDMGPDVHAVLVRPKMSGEESQVCKRIVHCVRCVTNPDGSSEIVEDYSYVNLPASAFSDQPCEGVDSCMSGGAGGMGGGTNSGAGGGTGGTGGTSGGGTIPPPGGGGGGGGGGIIPPPGSGGCPPGYTMISNGDCVQILPQGGRSGNSAPAAPVSPGPSQRNILDYLYDLLTNGTDTHVMTMSSGVPGYAAPVSSAGFTILSPAALTGNVNNWNPGTLSDRTVIRITTNGGGPYSITGITGGSAGKEIICVLIHATDSVILKDDDAGSSAGNRFQCGSLDAVLNAQNTNRTFVHSADHNNDRWLMTSPGGV